MLINIISVLTIRVLLALHLTFQRCPSSNQQYVLFMDAKIHIFIEINSRSQSTSSGNAVCPECGGLTPVTCDRGLSRRSLS